MLKYSIPITSMLIVLVLIGFGLKRGAIPLDNDPFAVYQKPKIEKFQAGFHFENKSDLLDLPKTAGSDIFTIYISAGDIDNDGFEDLALINRSSESGEVIKILKNTAGKKFTDTTSESLIVPKGNYTFSAVAFVDLDNDGWEDLYVAQFMKPHFVLKNNQGKFNFANQIPIDKIIAPTRGISLFDYNNDGFVDLYLNSFSESVYAALFTGEGYSKVPYPIRSKSGSENILVSNQSGKKLVQVKNSLGLADGGYTWAVGIADIDDDGYPEVFVGNDFGYDHFYKNEGGKSFSDISEQALGNIRSENSMGVEIGDVENNGNLGFYISNASKPGMPRGWNHLWKTGQSQKEQLRDVASNLEIDKCGFSWGAKFSDLDKDGKLDLFVVNGRTGKADTTNNRWYYRLYDWSIPAELKYSKYVQVPIEGYNWASGQRSCVFVQRSGKFVDLAEEVGVTDKENGRSLAVIDFNNDGQEDFVVGNLEHDPILYQGFRANDNRWLGLKLTGKSGNRDAIGAKVKLYTENSVQTRMVFPSNGFGSISSKRIIFGVAKNEQVKKVEIFWPSKKVQTLNPEELNRYYDIVEVL